jgi:hypothetical protein
MRHLYFSILLNIEENMKIIIGCIFFITFVAFTQTTIPPGNVSGVWEKTGNPFLIIGDINVQNGNTLTLQPGVIVRFQGNFRMNVYGRLLAIGAVNDTILFTAQDTAIGWHGIRFYNSNSNSMDSSKLILCKFTAGKALGTGVDQKGGAIFCDQSSDILIKNCIFMNNYAAQDGGAIAFMNNSAALVDNCLFMYNDCYFYGGSIYVDASNTKIKNSVFTNNHATFFGAAITGWNNAAFVLENSKILNNQAGAVCGVYTAQGCSPLIINTLFVGNSNTLGNGGAAGFSVSSPTLINVTIANNTATQNGGGLWIYNSTAVIKNSIIWNNNPDQINVNNSTVTVNYSDIMGGFTGTGNINLDPKFLGTGLHPQSIQDISPCRNAGIPDTIGLNLPHWDLANNPRISENRIDIGAYEYHGIVPVELTSFSINTVKNSAFINWTTATEKNNKGFFVERKSSGGEFSSINFVKGYGTTTEQQSYSYADKNLQAGKYYYRLRQTDYDGTFDLSNTIEVNIEQPAIFSLSQNYPNPFNPSTVINFSIPKAGIVTMNVYDVLGKEVATLINEKKDAGSYDIVFDGSNLSSGVYYYKLSCGNYSDIKKMIFIK